MQRAERALPNTLEYRRRRALEAFAWAGLDVEQILGYRRRGELPPWLGFVLRNGETFGAPVEVVWDLKRFRRVAAEFGVPLRLYLRPAQWREVMHEACYLVEWD